MPTHPPPAQATKLFVSNLNARLAQRFLALVLLPRIRQEIREKQRLHLALFMALKKATYKPGAFYKVGLRGRGKRGGGGARMTSRSMHHAWDCA